MKNVTQIPKIDFVDNATTKEAFVYSCRYTFVFWRNVWRSVNCFVHRWPWFCVAVTALLVIAISHASIGQARAERDYANKQATLSIPQPRKPLFMEQLEEQFIKEFNRRQPHAVNKAVKVHIMRN